MNRRKKRNISSIYTEEMDKSTPYRLFGKPVQIKRMGCEHDNWPGQPIPPSVNVFVKVTNGCNAHCRFCSNGGAAHTGSFNIGKLLEVLYETGHNGIRVNRLNITGGEPSCVPRLVERILEHMDEPPFDSIHVHLNTNGLLPASQALMKHPRWDSISVSLHHYERAKLSELYGVHIPDTAISFEGVNPMKVNASCNLIKGYIDSTAEAWHMMDFCLDHDFTRLGFVGLMPVNDFCNRHLVELDELHLEEIPHCYFTESQHRGKDCRCSNYLYNRHLKVLDVYMRHYANPNYCESSLLFDGEYLRQGFYEDNIIF